VDGVYDSDPNQNSDAKLYKSLTYAHVLNKELRVMDSTAIALCKENDIPILVFNLNVRGNIHRAVMGESIGTLVGGSCEIS
ncbi:MAG: UMP kinase, partial [Cyanobacteria bacterium J06573_2]